MNAIILGLGEGTRLLPFTAAAPKLLVPIVGKPLLAHQLAVLRSWGIRSVYVWLHTSHDSPNTRRQIEALQLSGNTRYLPTRVLEHYGELAALAAADEPLLVINCDILLRPEWAGAIEHHHESRSDLTIACSNGSGATAGKLRWGRFDGGRLTSHRKTFAHGHTPIHEIGMSVVSPIVWPELEELPLQEEDPWSDELIPRVLDRLSVGVYYSNGGWQDVGTWPRVFRAHSHVCEGLYPESDIFIRLLQRTSRASLLGDEVSISASAIVSSSFAGPGCRIGAHSVVAQSILMHNVTVGEAAVLEHCIVLPDAVIPAGLRYCRSVIACDQYVAPLISE